MSDILACVECLVFHCIALRQGTQVGKFHYWALLTLSREKTISGTEDALGDGTHPGP